LSITEQRAVGLILAWSLAFLYRNPTRLGINIDGIAAKTWTSYINTYEKALNMAWLNAEQTLWNMTYLDCTDFNNFIINMHNKWSDAKVLGSKINNKDFKNIIITSLPKSWNPIAAPLYDLNMTSADMIARLQIWYTKINKN